jgi:hypothetical protein
VHGDAQVEGLQAAAAGVAAGEGGAGGVQQGVVIADRLPTSSGRASSSVRRIFSPPGTSPTPVLPALSVRITRLRVK